MDEYVQTAGVRRANDQMPVTSCQGGIFVPVQDNSETWPPAQALAMGTAFPCLYDPWEKGEKSYD